jgi:hypothetical protein
MQRPILAVAIFAIAATVSAQAVGQQPVQQPHPSTLTPPAQPPIILNSPPPPPDRVDLKSGKAEPAKRCTRDVFYPCPDERGKNCIRKETYRCD